MVVEQVTLESPPPTILSDHQEVISDSNGSIDNEQHLNMNDEKNAKKGKVDNRDNKGETNIDNFSGDDDDAIIVKHTHAQSTVVSAETKEPGISIQLSEEECQQLRKQLSV